MDYRSPEAEAATRRRVREIGDAFRGVADHGDVSILDKPCPVVATAGAADASPLRKYEATTWTQFRLLFQRAWRSKQRDSVALIIAAVSNTVFGLLLGSIYNNMGYEQTELQDRGQLQRRRGAQHSAPYSQTRSPLLYGYAALAGYP